ncbi:unnamed protein product, partial [Heterosigma akashiwo]
KAIGRGPTGSSGSSKGGGAVRPHREAHVPPEARGGGQGQGARRPAPGAEGGGAAEGAQRGAGPA